LAALTILDDALLRRQRRGESLVLSLHFGDTRLQPRRHAGAAGELLLLFYTHCLER